jgi:2-oxoglutarate dehydrogenase complex dehydrogenase (E1) component-like enzyme
VSTSSVPEAGQFGPNEWLVEEMYQRFLDDPAAVDPVWCDFFADYRPVDTGGAATISGAGAVAPTGPVGGAVAPVGPAAATVAPQAGSTAGPDAGGRTTAAAPAPARLAGDKPVAESTSRAARPAAAE